MKLDARGCPRRIILKSGWIWDDELLALELQELNEADFDLSLTGFDPKELDDLLLPPEDDEAANAVPPLPEVPASRVGDLWLCGPHRVLCGDCTSADVVATLLGDRKPALMVTDPPYGISLDSEWRDRAGLDGCGPAEASYMKKRTKGHNEMTISGDTRADWSDAFELVPSLQIAYVWHASVFTREVLSGLQRIGFLYPQQIIWNKGRIRLLKRLEVLEQRCPAFVDTGMRERITTVAIKRLSRADVDPFISGAEAHQQGRDLTAQEMAAREAFEAALRRLQRLQSTPGSEAVAADRRLAEILRERGRIRRTLRVARDPT